MNLRSIACLFFSSLAVVAANGAVSVRIVQNQSPAPGLASFTLQAFGDQGEIINSVAGLNFDGVHQVTPAYGATSAHAGLWTGANGASELDWRAYDTHLLFDPADQLSVVGFIGSMSEAHDSSNPAGLSLNSAGHDAAVGVGSFKFNSATDQIVLTPAAASSNLPFMQLIAPVGSFPTFDFALYDSTGSRYEFQSAGGVPDVWDGIDEYSLNPLPKPPAPTPPPFQPPVVPPVVTPVETPPSHPVPPVTQPPATPPMPPVPAPPVVPPAAPPVQPPAEPTMGNLSLARHSRAVTAEEIAGGAPAGGFVHEFFVTSTTDLLCVSPAQVDVPVYQHAQGSDMEPPREEVTAFAPGVTADSFIDMPGDTLTLGNGWVDHTGLWGDLSNDGGQEDFLFARFTTMGETGTFSGKMFARSYDTPVSLDFSFTLPGTEADFALLDGEPTYELAHSLDPPPVVVTPPVETPPVTTPPFAGPVEPAPTPQPPIEIPPPPTYPEIEVPHQPFPPIAEQPPVENPPAEQPPGEPTPGEPGGPGDPTPTFIDVVHCGLIIGDWASTGFTRPMVVNPDGSLVDLMHFDLDRPIDGSIPVFRTWWRQLGANTDGVINGGLEVDGTLDPTRVYAFSGASSASPFDLFLGDVDRPIVTQATEVRIPEPSALALLAGASVCLAAARRRPRPRR